MKTNKKIEITILRPGGNDTALIKGIIKKSLRKQINNEIMKRFPNVEQVGFYEYDKERNLARLEMAGGEFCGNATRSVAYLVLGSKKGEVNIKVSGAKKLLKAGVKKTGTAFAQMPIFKNLESIFELDSNLYRVDLEGITHLIMPKPNNINKKNIKTFAKKLLNKYDLLESKPASGLMLISSGKDLVLDPVIWVRDIQTLFYETACASGTAAVGLWQLIKNRANYFQGPIIQPSKQIIYVTAEKTENNFKDAFIEGPIKILKKAVIVYEN